MAADASQGSTLEAALPIVMQRGLNTNKATNLNGTTIDTSGNLAVQGTTTFTGSTSYNGGQTMPAAVLSALVGATVVLTAAQSGGVFVNRSTSGSPSWTLPTAAAGLYYTFLVSNTTTGFTVTGGTVFAKASATGVSVTGTTLTNTQATAVVGDAITLYCDGTSWRILSQTGVFAAA